MEEKRGSSTNRYRGYSHACSIIVNFCIAVFKKLSSMRNGKENHTKDLVTFVQVEAFWRACMHASQRRWQEGTRRRETLVRGNRSCPFVSCEGKKGECDCLGEWNCAAQPYCIHALFIGL
jgi:hypothetical protein